VGYFFYEIVITGTYYQCICFLQHEPEEYKQAPSDDMIIHGVAAILLQDV